MQFSPMVTYYNTIVQFHNYSDEIDNPPILFFYSFVHVYV